MKKNAKREIEKGKGRKRRETGTREREKRRTSIFIHWFGLSLETQHFFLQ